MVLIDSNQSLKSAKHKFEKAYITEVLNEKANSLRKTAEALEIHYSGLLRKLNKLEIAENTTRSVSNG